MIPIKYLLSSTIILCTANMLYAQSNKKEIEKWKKLAIESEQKAMECQKISEQQRMIASEAMKRASEESRKAENAMKDARQRQYLATADAVAAKSTGVHDKELAALLALQAFNFHKTFRGYIFNDNIFKGLSKALANFDRFPKKVSGDMSSIRVLFSSSNNTFLAVGDDGKISRWSPGHQKWEVANILQLKSLKKEHAFDVNADLLAVASGKNSVEIYDLRIPTTQPTRFERFSGKVEKIILTPAGQKFYVLANDRKSIFGFTESTIKEVIKSVEKLTTIALSPDGTLLAATDIKGQLSIWTTSDHSLIQSRKLQEAAPVGSLTFLSNSRKIIVGGSNGIVEIISAETGKRERILYNHISPIRDIKISHSGKLMATVDANNRISIWNLEAINQQPITISSEKSIGSLIFSGGDTSILITQRQLARASMEEPIKELPIVMQSMAEELCGHVKRNLTVEEWQQYVDDSLPMEPTCPLK